MNGGHSGGNIGTVASPQDDGRRRREIVDKVLKRAELSKLTRTLQARLALAGYKAQRGWAQYNLDLIEPHLANEAAERDKKRRVLDGPFDSSYETGHPAKRRASPISSQQQVNNGRFTRVQSATLAYGSPQLTSAPLSHSTPSTHAIFPPSSGRGFQAVTPSSIKPLSTSDPTFARSATEYVDAANVLNSLSRAPSDPAVLARSGDPHGLYVASPRSAVNHVRRISHLPEASTPGRGGMNSRRLASQEEEEQEDAAELMLFLAASPSPQVKRAQDRTVLDVGASGHGPPLEHGQGAAGVKSRKLFGDDPSLSAGNVFRPGPAAFPGMGPGSEPAASAGSPFAAPALPQQQRTGGGGSLRPRPLGSFDPNDFLSLSPGTGPGRSGVGAGAGEGSGRSGTEGLIDTPW